MGGVCCSSDTHQQPSNLTEEEKENFFFKLAPPKKLIEANEFTVVLTKTVIEVPKFLDRLRMFNCTGTIIKEEESNFWMIKLDKNWQDRRDTLRKDVSNEPAFQRAEFINQGVDQAQK